MGLLITTPRVCTTQVRRLPKCVDVESFISKILAKPVLAGKIKNEHVFRYTEDTIEALLIVLRGRYIPRKYVVLSQILLTTRIYWLPGMPRTGAIEVEEENNALSLVQDTRLPLVNKDKHFSQVTIHSHFHTYSALVQPHGSLFLSFA